MQVAITDFSALTKSLLDAPVTEQTEGFVNFSAILSRCCHFVTECFHTWLHISIYNRAQKNGVKCRWLMLRSFYKRTNGNYLFDRSLLIMRWWSSHIIKIHHPHGFYSPTKSSVLVQTSTQQQLLFCEGKHFALGNNSCTSVFTFFGGYIICFTLQFSAMRSNYWIRPIKSMGNEDELDDASTIEAEAQEQEKKRRRRRVIKP